MSAPVAALPGRDATSALTDSPRTTVDAAALATDAVAWDRFVAGAPNGSFPQLTAWAGANSEKGWRAVRLASATSSGPIGAQLLIHAMRPGPWSRAYAPRGPIAGVVDEESVKAFTLAVRRAAHEHRLSHLLIDPELAVGHPVEGWLSSQGWRHVPRVLINRTRIIDLAGTEGQLWAGLRSSARWSVNKARRSGLSVDDAGAAGLDDFERLYLETARRIGFRPAAFRTIFRAFAEATDARLLIARDADGRPAATHMLIPCGARVIELYGASSAAGSRARANYLVKWEAIRSSRERGYARYDMWGTDDDTPGLAEFKAGFGGAEIEYIGAWELVTDRRARVALEAVRRTRSLPQTLRRLVARSRGRPTAGP